MPGFRQGHKNLIQPSITATLWNFSPRGGNIHRGYAREMRCLYGVDTHETRQKIALLKEFNW